MTVPWGKVLSAGCVVLAAQLSWAPGASAGPPVPPPPKYEAPRWPVPVAGQWRTPSAPAPRRTPTRAPAQLIAEVNRHREGAGCAPVRPRASLNRAARAHSADMAAHGRLTHSGTDGSRPGDRMRAAGYRPGGTGEVVSAGPATAAAVVTRWMDSPQHRAILLTCRYTDAGAGMAAGPDGPWWTLDLAARR